ncbi:MAG TPA: C40 family peptidase [Candidatus Aquilonibacter sp.]|nr:C40 family peptidase [Candidatus Aquilonibacter sp.]
MRQALAAGAFALLLAGSTLAIARADETPATTTESQTTVSQPVETAVQSPDVAEWTAHLIVTTHNEHAGKNGEIRSFAGGVLARTSKIAQQLTKSALRFLGVPYVFGGTSPSGFDCSGYVQHVFAMLGISVPRTADAQYDAGHRIVGGMKPGDLVFFQTYEPGPSHVGIYIGNNRFVHASSHGVMVSSLSESYWRARYIGAKRLLASR